MIYEEFEVVPLEAVRYEQSVISVKPKKEIRHRKKREKSPKEHSGGGGSVIDLLIKQCFICILILLMFAGLNFIGLDAFIENLKQVVESSSVTDVFTNAHFV